MPAEDVESGSSTRVEDSGALPQQVEDPNGPPRGGTTSWEPQDLVTWSTPAAAETDIFGPRNEPCGHENGLRS